MLSKSRFVTGVQCHKLLWWKVHEPNATELQPGTVLQDLFDQGRHVGEVARERHPGGVLIDLPHREYEARAAATKTALADGAPAIFEAAFIHDDTFVAIDILEKTLDGYRLIEVKGSTEQKDEHIPDVAVQAHVAAANGVQVTSVAVMHLNRDYRHPGSPSPEGRGGQGVRTGELFARTDVVAPVVAYVGGVAEEIASQKKMLVGPLPDVPIGLHCFEPRDCPFMARCWPDNPDHIGNLYLVGPKKTDGYLRRGIHSVNDLPSNEKLNFAQKRQLKAMKENRLIVEPTLAEKLAPFLSPLSRRERGLGGEDPSPEGRGGSGVRTGFLDFETIARAIPVWPGMGPWHQAAAQFSYHEQQPDGSYTHAAFLAEGPQDARPALVAAMIRATAKADRVVMYTPFERTQIRDLHKHVPQFAAELAVLQAKLLDLAPVVRDCVYHPDFRGSFSLKRILTPLVPELSYNDLIIVDGRVASVEIARLLFVADKIPKHERDRVRQDLLNYCERDTWATVRLLEELKKLAYAASATTSSQ